MRICIAMSMSRKFPAGCSRIEWGIRFGSALKTTSRLCMAVNKRLDLVVEADVNKAYASIKRTTHAHPAWSGLYRLQPAAGLQPGFSPPTTGSCVLLKRD